MIKTLLLNNKEYKKKKKVKGSLTNTKAYKWYQLYCVFPPIALLWLQKPIYLTLVYSVLGAIFMPFMILTLLYLGGSMKRIGKLKNSTLYVTVSVLILALYAFLGWKKLVGLV